MRLIDADELFNWGTHKLKDAVKYGNKDGNQQSWSYSTLMMYEVADEIFDTPTVDAIPVAHGKWIGYETNSFKNSCEGIKRKFYRCSVCRTANVIRANYCPNCGTKIDGK